MPFFPNNRTFNRVWLCPREDAQQPIQRLKVLNIIPKVKITGREHDLFIEQKSGNRLSYSSLELPTFETIDELVPHLNQLLQANKYFGKNAVFVLPRYN